MSKLREIWNQLGVNFSKSRPLPFSAEAREQGEANRYNKEVSQE